MRRAPPSSRDLRRVALASIASLLAACACPSPPAASPPRATATASPALDRAAAERDVGRELDDLHDAAAKSDEERYMAHYAPGAVFLGTDATEHWDMAALRAYAHPRFSAGAGWVMHPSTRAIDFAADGSVAWFDERLQADKLGPARGSGVLVRRGGRWLVAQYNLALTVPNERFADVRALLDAPPVVDLRARYQRAYADATTAAASGDLARARALLAALVPEAKMRPGDDLEFWLHNELTWIRWAEGDLSDARDEVEQARATLDHGTLPADAERRLRLHERWDRAYLALEAALAAPAAQRARANAEADGDRAAYDAIAAPANDHDGMAVLAAFFAVRRHDGRAAAAAARKIDASADDDLQDLYVVAMALEAGGDAKAAAEVRARICAVEAYLMKPLIVRALSHDGHACAK